MVELCLSRESVWFDQRKFENAETRYHEILANRHSGLRIEGKGVAIMTSEPTESSSRITNQIQLIQQSLKTTPAPKSSSDLEQRVAQLESESKSLRATLQAVESRLSAIEAKVGVGGVEGEVTKENGGDDDNFELFGSDDENEDEAAAKLREQQLAAYHAKKAKKPQTVAKSSIILDVKPWDDETDIKEMEKLVRGITADGLLWGASKFVPVAYGIKKLQINCVVEDEKIGTDFLEESITAFEDYVQSMDIVAFNKI